MALLATAPIVRRFWPLSQVVRALETYKPQGYKSWLQQNSGGRYIFCFQTDRQAHDEHGFRVGTEVYEARFECVPRRVHENNPPRAGKIDPEELEMFEPHVLELLVELDEMQSTLHDAPDECETYSPPDEDFVHQHLSDILEMSLINGPAWRWSSSDGFWTLDSE